MKSLSLREIWALSFIIHIIHKEVLHLRQGQTSRALG